MMAIRELPLAKLATVQEKAVRAITSTDFHKALQTIKSSVSIEQLDHYFRIPKKEVFENVQNPKSNRSIKPGFTYNQNQANVSPNMGYDTPKGFQQKEALREE